jgi:hypothetical protein
MAPKIPLSEKQTFWLEHLQACTATGMSMRAYAQTNNLGISTFYSWKKTLQCKGLLGECLPDEPLLFRKAVVTACRVECCRVLHPSGVVLEFADGTDPLWIAALVRALP